MFHAFLNHIFLNNMLLPAGDTSTSHLKDFCCQTLHRSHDFIDYCTCGWAFMIFAPAFNQTILDSLDQKGAMC